MKEKPCTTDPVINKNQPPKETKNICRYYVRGTCKHGRKGTKCEYRHPTLCFKFTTKGDLKGGCKKGEDCKYLHPKICWSYNHGKVCHKTNCKFYQVKGTVFKKDEDFQHHPTADFPRAKTTNPSARTNAYDRPPHNGLPTNAVKENPRDGFTQHPDFLDMKQQMLILQEQMKILIGQRMQGPPHQPTGWGQPMRLQ